ncbi:MAG: sigma-70 family RNA polymerase sigma factor [Oscillospiraceae bacterium]|jgi:RNA polymerase sigma-70 factor (ECF subfamily)|nr:sigma-70 family RNA polymerase sigma factor [Oscillospiraceae bacterium]
MQEDALLLRRAQGGDADAFERLVSPHESRVYALCLRMMGSREDAQDCAQDAMLRVWHALPSYRREASFSTWLYRIAANTCLDALRRRKVRAASSLDAMLDEGYAPPDTAADPLLHAEASARKQALEAGIAALPDDMRAALVLRDVQGFSYEEVAAMLSAPLGTIKSRINRARDKLRAILSEQAELFDAPRVYTSERRTKA